MKKIISIALCLIMAFTLCACGKSQAVKDYEKMVKDIGTEIDYDSAELLAAARKAYNQLTEEEKKSVKIDDLEKLESEFFDLPCSPVKCAEYLKKSMKDPSSFRIYGEVLFVEFSEEITQKSFLTALLGDAKNGFGAYNGKNQYEVFALADTGEMLFMSEDSEHFMDLYNDYFNASEEQLEIFTSGGLKFIVFDGQTIADAIGCEYFE